MLLISRKEWYLDTTTAAKDEHIPFQIQDAFVSSHQVQSQQENFLVYVKNYEVHVELNMPNAQGTNNIADSPNNIGLAHTSCYPTLRSIDAIHQSQLLSQRDGYDAALGTAVDHHLTADSISKDTRCQAHVRLAAAGWGWSKRISLIRAIGVPSGRNVRRWRISRAANTDVELTHDASKGALVVAKSAMAYLARNSLGVADQEFAQVVEAGAGDDWNRCGNGRANDDWSGPATCGSWGDAEWII